MTDISTVLEVLGAIPFVSLLLKVSADISNESFAITPYIGGGNSAGNPFYPATYSFGFNIQDSRRNLAIDLVFSSSNNGMAFRTVTGTTDTSGQTWKKITSFD